jgi:hypothetical protein
MSDEIDFLFSFLFCFVFLGGFGLSKFSFPSLLHHEYALKSYNESSNWWRGVDRRTMVSSCAALGKDKGSCILASGRCISPNTTKSNAGKEKTKKSLVLYARMKRIL